MHEPKPFGLLQYGERLTADEIAFVSQQVQKVSNFKTISDLPSIRSVRALPTNGYMIIADMGGNIRVVTHKEPVIKEEQELSGYPHLEIPTFFSGSITAGRVRYGQGVEIELTEQCRKRINNYNGTAPKRLTLRRFEIEHNPYFVELIPQNAGSNFVTTQYANQRPTWYSGAMAQVQQIIGGYGILDLKRLPENKYEQAQLDIPKAVMKKIADELDGGILPAYYGYPAKNGQFQYDYKFERTDLVAVSEQGTAWLIRVNRSGMYAMPLPLIPATTTKAFREWAEEKEDSEIIAILDRFGGMPSGENFPKAGDFTAWQKAGVIIKICDTTDFYQNDAYYSACGWSANLNATEIVNTCYYHEDASGWQKGCLYIGYFSYGDIEKHGYFPKNKGKDTATPETLQKATEYAAKVSILFNGNSAKDLAVQYKLRRVDISLLASRANTVNFDENAEKQYWQDLELEPIATHSGGIHKWREDYIYAAGKPKNHPQIKFPEPIMGGCISHDFGRLDIGEQKKEFPDMDCPMFAYYIDNDLKTVHYFKDWVDWNKPVEDDYSECMTVGSWQKTEWLDPTQIKGNFYHSDFDDREEIAGRERYTQIKGKDRGYDHTPFFAFWEVFSRVGDMWRNRYFSHKTNTQTTSGRKLEVAICVPFYCRNAVLHANQNGNTGVEKTESQALYSIKDPNTYGFWTYDNIFHWRNTLKDEDGFVKMDGNPYPKKANPVWVEVHYYSPSTCSDFADMGDWVGGMPADYTWLIHPNPNEYLISGGGGAPTIEEYSETTKAKAVNSGSLKVSIAEYPQTAYDNRQPDLMYFEMSPSEMGDIFHRNADKNLMGETQYCSISEYKENGERYYWGQSSVADKTKNNHFIGVIDN